MGLDVIESEASSGRAVANSMSLMRDLAWPICFIHNSHITDGLEELKPGLAPDLVGARAIVSLPDESRLLMLMCASGRPEITQLDLALSART